MSDDFDLERFLPYLLNQAAEAASLSFAQVYRREYGMTRTQWRVLAHLGRFGVLTARDICLRSHLDKTKVSRSVAALEERGWLRRETSAQDRRAEILALTEAGQEVFWRLGALAVDHDRRLRERLGVERTEGLIDALHDLAASRPTGDDPDEII